MVAAIDLGSNSFHMIVARRVNGQLHVVDRLREMVQLAAGLDSQNRIDRGATVRALECLKRFAQRLSGMASRQIRCVGTNTLRRARNAGDFIAMAEGVLGYPIEVIAGREEARLIYLGVAHSVADAGRRLVIDIGGGSTELIIGEGLEPLITESLHIGCVGMSRGYFPHGVIRKNAFAEAELAAALEFQPVQKIIREQGWASAVGASGTILACAHVLQARIWTRSGISRSGLQRLRTALIETGHVRRITTWPGISAERAAVLPGGVAILCAAFQALGIKRLEVSEGALREGLLYDLLGRIGHHDIREHSIEALLERYHIDRAQALAVARSARALLAQVAEAWQLHAPEHTAWLEWAARLHEIGLAIDHTRYHRHGAYLVENADLPGFSRQDQRRVAVLIRAHRRKFPAALLHALPGSLHLAVLLRLAVLLHRARQPQMAPLKLDATHTTLTLRFPIGWLEHHPLTATDLRQEASDLKAAGLKLKIR